MKQCIISKTMDVILSCETIMQTFVAAEYLRNVGKMDLVDFKTYRLLRSVLDGKRAELFMEK